MVNKFCFFKRFLFLVVFCFASILFAENVSVHKYCVIELSDTVQPVSAEFIVNKINEANKANKYFLIIITLNTPGGLLASTEDITSAIMKSNVPVSVFVYPSGGKAASAGFFILLSSDFPAMAPATNTGAAHPVSAMPSFMSKGIDKEGKQSKGEKTPEKEKALEYASAFIRSIAQQRERPVDLAEKAVRESKAYTTNECIKNGLIDFVAKDRFELASKIAKEKLGLEGEIVESKVYKYSFREKLLSMLASPQIVYLLFLAGVIGVFIEIKSPGVVFPGLFGAICLILFFYATKTIPVNFAGVLFIILAVILLVLEFKVVSYGFLTIGGLVSMIIGSAMLFKSDLPGFSISLTSLIFVSFIVSAFVVFMLRMIVKTQLKKPEVGIESYIGKVAVSVTEINNNGGKIFFNGEYWNAKSDTTIDKEKKVIIINKNDNMVLTVKEKEE